jgi:hypothetical protein
MYQVCPVSIVFYSLPHTFSKYHLFLTILPLAVCHWKMIETTELNNKLPANYYPVQMKSAFGDMYAVFLTSAKS